MKNFLNLNALKESHFRLTLSFHQDVKRFNFSFAQKLTLNPKILKLLIEIVIEEDTTTNFSCCCCESNEMKCDFGTEKIT